MMDPLAPHAWWPRRRRDDCWTHRNTLTVGGRDAARRGPIQVWCLDDPMPIRNAPGKPNLIDQQEQIDALCAECRAEGRFAFDTEFVMEDRFESEV